MGEILKDMSLDLMGLGVGAGLGLTFYVVYKAGKNVVQFIQDSPEVVINKELINTLKEKGGIDASVWGKVQSDSVPIHSIQNPKVVGVVWKNTIKEHLMADVMGFWTNEHKTIDESTRSVPFSIVNNGVKVQVTNPNKLDSVDMSVVSEKFVSAQNSLTDFVWGYLKGIRSTGTQHTEEMLIEGTQVLGFGRLVYEKGLLRLKPHFSNPFILTTKDKQGVIEEYELPLTSLKVLSFISTCVAAYFSYRIIVKLVRYWKEYKKRRAENQVIETVRQQREAQDRDLPESLMCLVCYGLRDILLMPCKHICICGECFQKLGDRLCPVCRSYIETIQPLFYS